MMSYLIYDRTISNIIVTVTKPAFTYNARRFQTKNLKNLPRFSPRAEKNNRRSPVRSRARRLDLPLCFSYATFGSVAGGSAGKRKGLKGAREEENSGPRRRMHVWHKSDNFSPFSFVSRAAFLSI